MVIPVSFQNGNQGILRVSSVGIISDGCTSVHNTNWRFKSGKQITLLFLERERESDRQTDRQRFKITIISLKGPFDSPVNC